MTNQQVEIPQPVVAEDTRGELDLVGLRSHARQLQDDLEAIKAEIAAMKAAFRPSDEQASEIHEPLAAR